MSEQSEHMHFETALDDAGNKTMKVTIHDASGSHTTNLSTWSDLAQLLNVSMEMKKPDKPETIWVMESDICDQCGGLIGDFGICLDCGDDGVDWDDEEDDFTDFGDSDEDQAEIEQAVKQLSSTSGYYFPIDPEHPGLPKHFEFRPRQTRNSLGKNYVE